jgi:hypothetical protein
VSLVRASPAPYHALAAMLAQDRATQANRKLLAPDGFAKMQLLAPGARSFGFWRDGACVACAGFMPLLHPTPALRADPPPPGEGEIGRYEAWFTCLPGVARDLKSFLRLAQLTLDELPQDAIVEARVQPGWKPGEALARLLGFEHLGGDLWERIKT